MNDLKNEKEIVKFNIYNLITEKGITVDNDSNINIYSNYIAIKKIIK